jgi:hypothetical protein
MIVSLAIYAIYPDGWPGADPVRQGALIVASVALGAVFLPELSSNLWTIRSQDVRGLIPDEKVKSLQRALVDAQAGEEVWSDAVVDSSLEPLIGAEPHLVVQNLTYSISIHPKTRLLIDGEYREFLGIETTLRAMRLLPVHAQRNVYWVALARDPAALQEEFAVLGCLSREVASIDPTLSDDDWRRIAQQCCAARVVVDGVSISATLDAPSEELKTGNPRVVRWYFISTDLAKAVLRRQNVTVAFDFVDECSSTHFPIIFSAYYLIGGVQIVFRVYDQANEYSIGYESFLAFALPRGVDEQIISKPGLCTQLTVAARDDALIWPGSGVHVWWQRNQLSLAGLGG